MTGLTNLLLVLVMAETTNAAVSLYPQPEGAKACRIGRHKVGIGRIIYPSGGPLACTKVTCYQISEPPRTPHESSAEENGSDEGPYLAAVKLYGQVEGCPKTLIDGKTLSPALNSRLLAENEAKRQLAFPKCCVPEVV